MTQVKICGVCRPADAVTAARLGASYIGVILAPGRSRTQSVASAATIFASAGARRVGVFVDAAPVDVARVAGELALDVVQLHGDESPAAVRALVADGLEVWKAVRVRAPSDVLRAVDDFGGSAAGLLLDGWSAAGHGGVGARFDWDAAAEARRQIPAAMRVIVAGGLSAANVAGVVDVLEPEVVDVSSGVEAELGEKSHERMHSFIAAVRGAGVKK